MKINGFVTLKTWYIRSAVSQALQRIKEKRDLYKAEIIADKRKLMLKKSMFEKIFNIVKEIPTDEQVWKQLRKEDEYTFLGVYPDCWVDNLLVSYEHTLKELDSACSEVSEMLVNTEVAAKLARGSNF